MNRSIIAAADNLVTSYIRLVDIGPYKESRAEIEYWLQTYTDGGVEERSKPLVQILEIILEAIEENIERMERTT